MHGCLPLRARHSLVSIARSSTIRIDAKQADPNCVRLDSMLDSVVTFKLNETLPSLFIKGRQPSYLRACKEITALV